MARKSLLVTVLALWVLLVPAVAQETLRFNLNIGGGFAFPQGNTSTFVNKGGSFSVGGGPNFGRLFGVSGEYYWQSLPIKQSVIQQVGVPSANARIYSLLGNGIFRIPSGRRVGGYLIGGGGWYHFVGQTTAPTLTPGIVCPPLWTWWGYCVGGLFPATTVLNTKSWNSFGGNFGGGFTYRLSGNTQLYAELRYHYVPHQIANVQVLPLIFGVRW